MDSSGYYPETIVAPILKGLFMSQTCARMEPQAELGFTTPETRGARLRQVGLVTDAVDVPVPSTPGTTQPNVRHPITPMPSLTDTHLPNTDSSAGYVRVRDQAAS